ncbi:MULTISPECIES: hypothetical protein [Pseudoalteromonas]|uniref:VCBS repeat-containing protein n=1 Tax=Pseudoalteromonas rubra TaxID=43658 RepID=A0A0U3GRM1_9GAMM|nr:MULTISPECIES: hypothetical protein [Pseudoalteromonas]ALU41843.1 hypothetical protein AT705_02230 [Pseudoalteromonas rubra]MDK1310767.1 hypothetical protein [Pseudoalteromonas sp. R96]
MKIENAQVNISNQHEGQSHVYEKRTEITELPGPENVNSAQPGNGEQGMAGEVADVDNTATDLDMQTSARMYILKLLVEKLAGSDVQWYDAVVGKDISHAEMSQIMSASEQAPATEVIVERLSHESQANVFKADGQIQLENGETISFAFKSVFAQSHTSYERTIENVDMKDPLIISFTNRAVELDTERMDFDIDADGNKDNFAQLKKGYGYLALDLNQNNQIDDGKELFGALSGNGFADLTQYDDDGNGFIDENDDIFDSLKVWVKNKEQDELISLHDANIGAIALHNADTPLNIRTDGALQGAIRKSGFYLDENGKPGLVQQVDYVV